MFENVGQIFFTEFNVKTKYLFLYVVIFLYDLFYMLKYKSQYIMINN